MIKKRPIKLFKTKENKPFFNTDDEEPCVREPTGAVITDGPLCGMPVFFIEKTQQCVVFNPLTKTFEEVDTNMNTIGTPVAPDKGKTCCTETMSVPFCADGADLTLTQEEILAAIPAGETFDLNAVAVDLAVNGINVTGAMIRVAPCPAPVVKLDGSVFETESAEVVMEQASGASLSLYQGACQQLGDGKSDQSTAIVIDETLTVKAGTAVYVDLQISACFDPAGEVIPTDEG